MAHDKDIKIKARAIYECGNEKISFAKVAEQLMLRGDIDEISRKTIEYWASKDKKNGNPWIKGKYKSLSDAIEALLPKEVTENIHETVKKKIVDSMANADAIEPEVIDMQTKEISKELVYQTLSKASLSTKLAESLLRAENIAKTMLNNMSIQATFHSMLTSTIQTVYGRKVEIAPQDPNSSILDDKELAQMSTEELLKIAKGE